jgi:hypothetical protein
MGSGALKEALKTAFALFQAALLKLFYPPGNLAGDSPRLALFLLRPRRFNPVFARGLRAFDDFYSVLCVHD